MNTKNIILFVVLIFTLVFAPPFAKSSQCFSRNSKASRSSTKKFSKALPRKISSPKVRVGKSTKHLSRSPTPHARINAGKKRISIEKKRPVKIASLARRKTTLTNKTPKFKSELRSRNSELLRNRNNSRRPIKAAIRRHRIIKSILSKRNGSKTGLYPSKLIREKLAVKKNTNHGSHHITTHGHHSNQGFVHHPSQIYHRVVWPGYSYVICYNSSPYFSFSYVYPYYHRKYVFVSLCGYWPIAYRYVRYYWYGWHPYIWYGYYPIVYEVKGDTYNYYTYNYYKDDVDAPDESDFSEEYKKFEEQTAGGPNEETLADRYFEDGVKAFEAGDYDIAAEKFAYALDLEPDDMVLPFAYVQALFADQQYSKAAKVLQEALSRLSPDQEGIFYPRGLYTNDDILFEQIERLEFKASLYPLDTDLQLLLGYQLLGVNRLDQAIEPLQLAGQDPEIEALSTVMLDLLEKIKGNKS
jgi:hypothetical protein